MANEAASSATVKAQLTRIEKLLKQEQGGIRGSASHRIGQGVADIQNELLILKNQLDRMEKVQLQMKKKL